MVDQLVDDCGRIFLLLLRRFSFPFFVLVRVTAMFCFFYFVAAFSRIVWEISPVGLEGVTACGAAAVQRRAQRSKI